MDLISEHIWHPMGAENESYWLLDSEGMDMPFAGVKATARDYAKLGELSLVKGATC